MRRLTKILVKEVSLVDKAANGEKFVFAKRAEGQSPEPEVIKKENPPAPPPANPPPPDEETPSPEQEAAILGLAKEGVKLALNLIG